MTVYVGNPGRLLQSERNLYIGFRNWQGACEHDHGTADRQPIGLPYSPIVVAHRHIWDGFSRDREARSSGLEPLGLVKDCRPSTVRAAARKPAVSLRTRSGQGSHPRSHSRPRPRIPCTGVLDVLHRTQIRNGRTTTLPILASRHTATVAIRPRSSTRPSWCLSGSYAAMHCDFLGARTSWFPECSTRTDGPERVSQSD